MTTEVKEPELPSQQEVIEETQETEWKTTQDEPEPQYTERIEYSVLQPTVIVTEDVSTLPAGGASPDSVQMQGFLQRKHDLEGSPKKAQNRSWNNVYCVLVNHELSFYDNAKCFALNETFQGEEALFLGNAVCEAVADSKKRKHVFRLRLSDGNEWLFQGKDESERQVWIDILRESITETSNQKAKSQSLPLPSTSALESKPDKKKKRFSFFPSKK